MFLKRHMVTTLGHSIIVSTLAAVLATTLVSRAAFADDIYNFYFQKPENRQSEEDVPRIGDPAWKERSPQVAPKKEKDAGIVINNTNNIKVPATTAAPAVVKTETPKQSSGPSLLQLQFGGGVMGTFVSNAFFYNEAGILSASLRLFDQLWARAGAGKTSWNTFTFAEVGWDPIRLSIADDWNLIELGVLGGSFFNINDTYYVGSRMSIHFLKNVAATATVRTNFGNHFLELGLATRL